MSKDQATGLIIFLACVAIAIAYCIGLFWPAFEAVCLWIVAIPVFMGFIVILAIGVWIGWTMTTTPPPKPIEEIELEEQKIKEGTTK